MPKTLASNRSIIWDYFKEYENDRSKAICIICKKILSRGSSDPHKQTTTGLKSHLKSHHNSIFKKLNDSTHSADATAAKASGSATTEVTVSKIGAASRPGSQTSRSLTSLDKFCVSRPVIPSSSESEPQGTGDWTIDTVSDVSDVTIEETAVTVSPVTVFSPKDARQMRQVRTNN